MLRRLLKMQTKTSRVVPMVNPNQDLTGIPLAELKGKEIRQEEFDNGSFFHQEPPPRASIRGGIGLSDGGTAGRAFHGEGGGVADPYGRSFGEGRWDSHPRYMGEIWRDHNNCYTEGGRSYWGDSDPKVRNLGMPVFKREDANGWVYLVEMYLMVNGVTKEERPTTVALYLGEKALAWFQWTIA
ncbi:hypothetical protein IEQ34_008959 [Dendrobium chrysotoxum]|uniref:Uncharacterized protein n=1 Tax=Dendrobium chrysotoxum TaxID=161865 RepID=A0AAV7GHY8_DENCH|nr:hypothetical protein IEQ34_008959 [Dendrobium chrysotoxum]